MPNDQTTSSNNIEEFTHTVFLSNSDTSTEQLYSTSGLVSSARRTSSGGAARLSRISQLNTGHTGISRIHARQTAKPAKEWGIGTPTHIQQSPNIHHHRHKPQAVPLIQFDTNPNKSARINTRCPRIESQTYTSKQPNRRGVSPIDPDKTYSLFMHPQRLSRSVTQDKARLETARPASLQPAADTKSIRALFTSNAVARSQNHTGATQKNDRVTLWGIDPVIKQQLESIALKEGLSLSTVGAAFLMRGLQQHVDMQYGALINPVIENAFAKQMSNLVTHLSWILVRIAFDCGQTRSLVTNILGRQPGVTESLLKAILQGSSNTAKGNIMRRTPQISDLINSVEQWMREESRGEKDKK